MEKIDIITKLLVLKDCTVEWAGIPSFFMMYYLFSTKMLETGALAIISVYINLPIWFYIISPFLFLIILGLINMFYLMPHKQAYYMSHNNEWKKFKKGLNKE